MLHAKIKLKSLLCFNVPCSTLTDPIFQFTQPVYASPEAISPAVTIIELISDTVLTSPVTILVSTVDGGSAIGENMYLVCAFCYYCYKVHTQVRQHSTLISQ